MVETQFCVYIGMRREFVPQCVESGSVKLITDDSDPGSCSINQKREDPGEWTEWSEVISEVNGSEWKRSTSAACC